MMNADIIKNYIEKVYGYAIKRTYSREEADELSQEILFTAIRELPKLRDENRFEPWLWGVADNVTKSFRRIMGKQRAMYSYDTLEETPYYDDSGEDSEELYTFLREKIVMLSVVYRNIIILYYYDGLSVRQISDKLGIPEGTVKWRLSEGRSKLKKECMDMTETILRPVQMRLDIYGDGNYDGKKIPFPHVYINDSLSQNILYYCYEESKTIEELAKLCGVPAYYVEERIDNLIKREAVIQPVKGRYQTDFIIWSDKYGIYCEENAETALMPVMDRMISALKTMAGEAKKIDFYKAEKDESELSYLYGVMAFEYARHKYCKLPYPEIKEKYDGYRWCYIANMESGSHHRIGIGRQHSANLGSRGTYNHTMYNFSGFKFRGMMYDDYINVCEDLLTAGKTADEICAAYAIRDGYIVKRENGVLFITTPSFTKAQKIQFDVLADRHLSPLMDEYSEIVNRFAAGYKKLFPKHLEDDASRMCENFFFGLYDYFVTYGQRTGNFVKPAPDSICDVMVQFK